MTSRDIDILTALDRCPLTVEQALTLSETFQAESFAGVRSVQDRLQKLSAAGWVRRWRYATTSRGASPHYYKLTLLGYRILYGETAIPSTKRQFQEVAIAHHHHTRSLAEFVVHTAVAAQRRGVRLTNFYRENTLRLTVGGDVLFPDCAFELLTLRRRQFNYLVELDNGTERVRSDKDAESWQRKIQLYDQLQQQTYPRRFRVLIVTTRSGERLGHILNTAGQLVTNRHRSLFYGVHLADYLSEPKAVTTPCFRDHRGQRVALLPLPQDTEKSPRSDAQIIEPPPRVC